MLKHNEPHARGQASVSAVGAGIGNGRKLCGSVGTNGGTAADISTCSSASTMARHLAISRSVSARMSATAAAAFCCLGMKGCKMGSFHSGSTSVARCSVSFSAVYTA